MCRNDSDFSDFEIAGKTFRSGSLNLPDVFSEDNYDETYAEIHKLGYIYTQSRSAPMSLYGLYGGTIGTTGMDATGT